MYRTNMCGLRLPRRLILLESILILAVNGVTGRWCGGNKSVYRVHVRRGWGVAAVTRRRGSEVRVNRISRLDLRPEILRIPTASAACACRTHGVQAIPEIRGLIVTHFCHTRHGGVASILSLLQLTGIYPAVWVPVTTIGPIEGQIAAVNQCGPADPPPKGAHGISEPCTLHLMLIGLWLCLHCLLSKRRPTRLQYLAGIS